MKTIRLLLTLYLALFAWPTAMILAADHSEDRINISLVWNQDGPYLSADLDGIELGKVLKKLATITGWEVRVEPDLEYDVRARFVNQPINQGLRKLLGNLNFALIPSTQNHHQTLYVFKTAFNKATLVVPAAQGPSVPDLKGRLLEDELIVWADRNAEIDMQQLAAAVGAKIVRQAPSLNAYRLKFANATSANQARELLCRLDGLQLGINEAYECPEVQRLLTPMVSLPPISIHPAGQPAQPVTVALVDTKIDSEHPLLKPFLLEEVDAVEPQPIARDRPSHGTAMALTVLQGLSQLAQPGAEVPVKILPINIYSDETGTTAFEVAMGLELAIRAGAQIVNLSLGSPTDHPLIRSIIESGTARGIVFVAAAGNMPTGEFVYPAAYEPVLAVTAIEGPGTLAPYANRGPFVDAAAPGWSVVPYSGQLYVVRGTSPAAAYASGVAAWLAFKEQLRGEALQAATIAHLPKPSD